MFWQHPLNNAPLWGKLRAPAACTSGPGLLQRSFPPSPNLLSSTVSIRGIHKRQRFRQSGVPEIWGSLQHLSVYSPPLLSQVTNISAWRYLWDWAWEAPDCQASVLAFRGAAARVVDYRCCWDEGAGFPAYCCRRGSQRSPSGWSCRIFSYPLHFRVLVSRSPLCSVLLEGCWGCETRQHLPETHSQLSGVIWPHLLRCWRKEYQTSLESRVSAGHRQWSSDRAFIILAFKWWT